MKDNDFGRYDDIIDLPRPVSQNHPQMSIDNRAAQFAPFAALTGFENAISRTELENERRVEEEIIHENFVEEC